MTDKPTCIEDDHEVRRTHRVHAVRKTGTLIRVRYTCRDCGQEWTEITDTRGVR